MKSWVSYDKNSDFSIHNFPFGIARIKGDKKVVTRIGDFAVALDDLFTSEFLHFDFLNREMLNNPFLNDFIALGKENCRSVRLAVQQLFLEENASKFESGIRLLLFPAESIEMALPVQVGDYTDFYSSIEHATNVGIMFRDPANALMPNWKHLPVGYHGRSSSIIASGVPIHRPKGQTRPNDNEPPVFGPTKALDFELEMGFITHNGKELGASISTEEAEDHIFGMCLFNDWSARDIQRWEYVPLGPFLSKNFASSMSPWIVTLDALEPFRVAGPVQDPKVLPYLEFKGDKNIDIALEVGLIPDQGKENTICRSNYKYMYWNMSQQLAHHTVNGCNIRTGDLMASGTISGHTPDSFGSMLELAWKGTKPITLSDGSQRSYLQDNDTVVMRGYAEKGDIRVGFGEVRTKILPAL